MLATHLRKRIRASFADDSVDVLEMLRLKGSTGGSEQVEATFLTTAIFGKGGHTRVAFSKRAPMQQILGASCRTLQPGITRIARESLRQKRPSDITDCDDTAGYISRTQSRRGDIQRPSTDLKCTWTHGLCSTGQRRRGDLGYGTAHSANYSAQSQQLLASEPPVVLA